MRLDEQLKAYTDMDVYPFHMPGHKRQWSFPADPYQVDITEIDGFDNLHHSEGILLEAQQAAAQLYRADHAWFLINGSTCGLLAAISAAAPRNSKVLCARNCHKAVYHALELRQLDPVYLYPEVTRFGLQGQLSAAAVQQAIRENPDAKALIVTSPTYDGVLSDIASLAQMAHEAGMALIVDQAHGAHFGLSEEMPQSAGALGADLVIVSTHKTLPAFTQTALLLSFSGRISPETIDHWLDIYETSSPSYILMAGIDRCVRFCASEEGRRAFARWRSNLDLFYEKTRPLSCLKIVRRDDFTPEEAWNFDESKILILTEQAGITGGELAEYLRRDYRIEPEMAAMNYALALTALMDTEAGYERLAEALRDLDRRLNGRQNMAAGRIPMHAASFYIPMERVMQIADAAEAPKQTVSAADAAGEVSGDYLYLYPPGIPLVVPGERIGEKVAAQLAAADAAGIEVCGRTPQGDLSVVKPTSLYYNKQIDAVKED